MTRARDMDEDDEQSGSTFSFQDVVACLRKRLWLILGCATIAAIGAALFTMTLSNRYEAVASIQIDQRQKRIVGVEGVISDLKADAATVESEVEIIKSKSTLLKVIEDLDLRNDAEFASISTVDSVLLRLGFSRPVATEQARRPIDAPGSPLSVSASPEPVRDALLNAVEGRLKVARVRMTLLIEIRFWSADPVKAARIASAIADTYLRSQVEAKQRATEHANDLIEDKLKGLRMKVAQAERAVETFRSQNNIFDGDGLLLVDRQIAREMETLVKSRNDATEAKARYEQARRMILTGGDNDSAAEVLRSHTVRLLRDEYTKALRREAELSTKYGPRHPEMQRIAADVAKAQAELTAETAKIIRNLKTEHEVAVDRIHQLEGGLDTLKIEIATAKDKQWQLKDLEREANASKQLYETLLTRNKQTAETQGFQLADSRLIESAGVPLYPAGPKRKQIVIGATFAGLLAGLGIAFLLDLAGPGLRRPEDFEQLVEAPVLTSVPLLATDETVIADPLRSVRAMMSDPAGSLANAIRDLRVGLDRLAPRGKARILQISSTLPGEGSTLIAANLALDYALSHRRVLLIDGDLRHGNLSHLLGLGGRPGLLDSLAISDHAEAHILRDGASGLHVLPASSGSERAMAASEALSSPDFETTIARLKSQFDVIVIDTPALLPVMDGRIIADHADQIAFVMTWRRTPKQLARRALQLLGPNRGKVAGVIMNRVEMNVEAPGRSSAIADRRIALAVERHAA